jgi:hypothetical protein
LFRTYENGKTNSTQKLIKVESDYQLPMILASFAEITLSLQVASVQNPELTPVIAIFANGNNY